MLVLSRKPGEKIKIGEHVSITIVRIGPNNVRIGIDAPKNMSILREELQIDEIQATDHIDIVEST
jgi:carbon storage regulator